MWRGQRAEVLSMSKNKINLVRKDNSQLLGLIQKLQRTNKPIWKKVAHELAKPRRMRIEVNLNKIEKNAKDSEVLVVPGKVLGAGQIKKRTTVAAFSFSESAKKMIHDSGGKAITIHDLFTNHPDGKNILILT